MAYTGRICYGNLPKNCAWCQNIKIHPSTPNGLPDPPSYWLEAPLFEFDANRYTAPHEGSTNHDIREESESVVGLIRYDQKVSHDVGNLACVFVARSWARNGWGRGWEDGCGDDRQDGDDSSRGRALGIRYDRGSVSEQETGHFQYEDMCDSDEEEWHDDKPDLALEYVLLVARRDDEGTYGRVGVAVICTEYLTDFPEETFFVI